MTFEIREAGQPTIEAYSTEEFLKAVIDRIEYYNINNKDTFGIIIRKYYGGEKK